MLSHGLPQVLCSWQVWHMAFSHEQSCGRSQKHDFLPGAAAMVELSIALSLLFLLSVSLQGNASYNKAKQSADIEGSAFGLVDCYVSEK